MNALYIFCAGVGAGALGGGALTWLAMRVYHRRLVRGVQRAAKLIGTKPGVIFAKGKKQPWKRKRH